MAQGIITKRLADLVCNFIIFAIVTGETMMECWHKNLPYYQMWVCVYKTGWIILNHQSFNGSHTNSLIASSRLLILKEDLIISSCRRGNVLDTRFISDACMLHLQSTLTAGFKHMLIHRLGNSLRTLILLCFVLPGGGAEEGPGVRTGQAAAHPVLVWLHEELCEDDTTKPGLLWSRCKYLFREVTNDNSHSSSLIIQGIRSRIITNICIHACVCIYTHIYTYIHTHNFIYIYIDWQCKHFFIWTKGGAHWTVVTPVRYEPFNSV